MQEFSKAELEQSIKALVSLISKCQKVSLKIKEGSAQATLLKRRIRAFQIAKTLMENSLEKGDYQ